MAGQAQLALFEPADEAGTYHDTARTGFFSLLVAVGKDKRQDSYRLTDMPTILGMVDQTRDTWLTQAEFMRPNRRVVNLARVGLLFADLDTYRQPWATGRTPEQLAATVLYHCAQEGIPTPSLLVYSGRGIQAKWLLDGTLPRQSFEFYAIQDAAEGQGFTTLVVNTDNSLEREQAAIRSLIERQVDGIALVSAQAAPTAALQEAIRLAIPVVAMDRRIEEAGIDQVTINTRQGTREAVLHLAAQGRRRIAFIAGPAQLWTAAEKRAGYREGLKLARLSYDPALAFPGDYSFASGERQATAMLEAGGARPDALIAGNNLMAFGAMRALLRRDGRREVKIGAVHGLPPRSGLKKGANVLADPGRVKPGQSCDASAARGRQPGRDRQAQRHAGRARAR